MWVNPKYASQVASTSPPPAPPEPSGRELARFDRPGFGRKADGQMVLSLDEFNGNPFLSLRLWTKGADGSFYPSRTGCSVRISEGEAMADALLKGVLLAHTTPARLPSTGPRRRSAPTRSSTARGTSRSNRPADPPRPRSGQGTDQGGDFEQDFDEFGS